MSLQNLLKARQCIKIICGAGNEDLEQIAYLTSIYAQVGVRYFDISANIEAIRTVRRVLNELGIEGYICVSCGIKGDPHMNKIVMSNACTNCGKCIEQCPQKVFYKTTDSSINIHEERCLGCGHCISSCKEGALSLQNKPKNIIDTLPAIVAEGIDTIEFHANGTIDDIFQKLSLIEEHYKGIISICMDRSLYGDKQLADIFTKFVSNREPYTTIIQADGLPMGGNNDSLGTTLQALAFGQIVERMKLPAYLLLSGGTNEQTTHLASLMGLQYNGISVGSFARKIIDGHSNEEALIIASTFLLKSLYYME
jgi:NAD-dependent dihydropyrimidine dehydrogenase PreA subunit